MANNGFHLTVLALSARSAADVKRWAVTESLHTRKEIIHSGHPTDIQHH